MVSKIACALFGECCSGVRLTLLSQVGIELFEESRIRSPLDSVDAPEGGSAQSVLLNSISVLSKILHQDEKDLMDSML